MARQPRRPPSPPDLGTHLLRPRALRRSARFSVRPRVRVAVARNPYCPTGLALALIGALPRTVLREMETDGTLDERVRAHVRDVFVRRGRAP